VSDIVLRPLVRTQLVSSRLWFKSKIKVYLLFSRSDFVAFLCGCGGDEGARGSYDVFSIASGFALDGSQLALFGTLAI
jgi:hypothetical protein